MKLSLKTHTYIYIIYHIGDLCVFKLLSKFLLGYNHSITKSYFCYCVIAMIENAEKKPISLFFQSILMNIY
jgi:hypothetical protein